MTTATGSSGSQMNPAVSATRFQSATTMTTSVSKSTAAPTLKTIFDATQSEISELSSTLHTAEREPESKADRDFIQLSQDLCHVSSQILGVCEAKNSDRLENHQAMSAMSILCDAKFQRDYLKLLHQEQPESRYKVSGIKSLHSTYLATLRQTVSNEGGHEVTKSDFETKEFLEFCSKVCEAGNAILVKVRKDSSPSNQGFSHSKTAQGSTRSHSTTTMHTPIYKLCTVLMNSLVIFEYFKDEHQTSNNRIEGRSNSEKTKHEHWLWGWKFMVATIFGVIILIVVVVLWLDHFEKQQKRRGEEHELRRLENRRNDDEDGDEDGPPPYSAREIFSQGSGSHASNSPGDSSGEIHHPHGSESRRSSVSSGPTEGANRTHHSGHSQASGSGFHDRRGSISSRVSSIGDQTEAHHSLLSGRRRSSTSSAASASDLSRRGSQA